MKIPFKSKLAKIKSLKLRNAKFKKLTPSEKRKEIAFDALNLVIIGKLNASHGSYWGGELMSLQSNLCDAGENAEVFQKALINDLPSCEVCQRGLLMVSTIRVGNNISPDDGDVDEGSRSMLKGKGFKIENFWEMEDEFENDIYRHPYATNTDEKLMNICCNVIANGNFKKRDTTDYLVKWGIKIDKSLKAQCQVLVD